MPRRVNLSVRSWPFLGSIALHVVMFEILFFPMLQPSTVMLSQAPNVLWLTPFIVPGDSGHLAGLLGQPAAAFAQQAEAPEPVSADSTEDAIADDLPAAPLAAPPATSDETGGANADAILIQTPPKVRNEAARRLPDSTPPPRPARPLPAQPVNRKPALPPSKPLREEQQALPAEQAGVIRVEKEQAYKDKVERQDEEDRLSRELAAQKQALAENARREQLAREQAQQAIYEQSERERVAAEKQEARKKLQQELRDQEEQERLAAEKARQVRRARDQQQQALREQAERKQAAAAEKARLDREAQEKLQQARRIEEEQERLAAEKARKVQRAREQQQQALREQTERKQTAAAEQARQEREAQEQLLRERKLQEEMMRRKKAEQPLEKPKRVLLALAEKKPENPIPKSSENRIEKPSAPQPQKGLVLPHLKGDLKLVATGSTLPNMTMTFKDFPLSRRNRPFSRAEARHEKLITPLVATTQEKSREVVIEKTIPGVYTITVAPVGGKADVDFSLKLYEGSSRAIVRTLGRHVLAGTKVVFKILMPEGILWQDDKAFTGSMEDSDSITKFSAGTGLVWKEYNN